MKKKRIVFGILALVLLISIYVGTNYSDLKSVYSMQDDIKSKIEGMSFCLGGDVVGIKLLATGVLVMGVDEDLNNIIQIGDIILSVNSNKITTGNELSEYVKKSNGEKVILEVDRKGKVYNIELSPTYDELSESYSLGLWVKDSSAGVGTVTFYEKNNKYFAALGHGVTETKENYILPITSGAITTTHIYNVKKGAPKVPRRNKRNNNNRYNWGNLW